MTLGANFRKRSVRDCSGNPFFVRWQNRGEKKKIEAKSPTPDSSSGGTPKFFEWFD